MEIEVHELSPERWGDLERLFGPRGACAGCWCMYWRLEKGERFDEVKGAAAKRRFRKLVMQGRARGFLAYVDDEPVGWLAAGRRVEFPKLDRAPSLACDDAERVHALPCFFVRSAFHGRGVATAMLSFAVKTLARQKAQVLEGYPVKPSAGTSRIPAAFAYTGTLPLFLRQGFRVVKAKPTGKQRVRLALGARSK